MRHLRCWWRRWHRAQAFARLAQRLCLLTCHAIQATLRSLLRLPSSAFRSSPRHQRAAGVPPCDLSESRSRKKEPTSGKSYSTNITTGLEGIVACRRRNNQPDSTGVASLRLWLPQKTPTIARKMRSSISSRWAIVAIFCGIKSLSLHLTSINHQRPEEFLNHEVPDAVLQK